MGEAGMQTGCGVADMETRSGRDRVEPSGASIGRALEPLFRGEPSIWAAWLFGSRACGAARPSSDIDLAILAASPQQGEDRLRRRLRWTVQVADALDWPDERLDVVDLRDAPILVAHEAMSTGVLLYDAQPAARVDFQVAALHRAEVARYLRSVAMRVRAARLAPEAP